MRKTLETASWIAGIAGFGWAVWAYFLPPAQGPAPVPVQPSSPGPADPDRRDEMPTDLLRRLVPPLQSSMSLRNAEKYLGVPIEESPEERTYEKFGLRITLFGIGADKSYSGVELGPARTNPRTDPVDLSGAWGSLVGRFGQLTVADVHRSVTCKKISDFNHGASAPCMNVFEIECGGAQYQSNYVIRSGIMPACHYRDYSEKTLSDVALLEAYRAYKGLPLGAPIPGLDTIIEDEYLDLFMAPGVADAKINFFVISTEERQEPRAAGGGR